MRKYELTVILSGKNEEALTSKLVDKITKTVEELKGKVEKIDKWGKKDLSFQIKKQSQGFYFHFQLKLDSKKAMDLEKKLKTDENIIRYLLISLGA